MREILFRGKRVDNGDFAYGVPIINTDCVPPKYMMQVCVIGGGLGVGYKEVISETVGQFTGLVDKHGRKIFEGDIIEYPPQRKKFIVEFHNDCFGARDKKDKRTRIGSGDDFIIIGNIHDQKEDV